MKGFVYLDFEFNHSTDRDVKLVCVAFERFEKSERVDEGAIWLLDDDFAVFELQAFFEDWKANGDTLVAYAAQAEARSLLSAGLNPLEVKWVDLYLEYKMLLNHNHEIAYGRQLIRGQVKTVKPPIPKYERTEEDNYKSEKPEQNLVAACFKMLDVRLDSKHKDAMRDLIIADKDLDVEENRRAIMEYCRGDVKYLRELHVAIVRKLQTSYAKEDTKHLLAEIHRRAEYAVRTALMERCGYPINYQATRNFSNSVASILYEIQKEISDSFPDINPFLSNRDGTKFIQKEKNIRTWLESQAFGNWMRTEKGKLSLSLDAFQRHFNFSNEYPSDNFGAQMVRLLKTKQSLNGFMPAKAGKRNFWDSVGSDKRVRPFLGIYGAQSGRSQPSSTGFIPLKASWMRCLIEPPRGRAIVGIDYSQQEFFLAALLSRDANMIEAYESGDVYLYTGKLAGAIPWEATKKTHPFLRDKFKSTCLAKGSLIRVKGCGYKPIEEITEHDEVWDGEEWRRSAGARYMGFKDVHNLEGVFVTEDHKILTKGGKWVEFRDIKKVRREGKVCFEDLERLRAPRASWSDVWGVARIIFRHHAQEVRSAIRRVFRRIRD